MIYLDNLIYCILMKSEKPIHKDDLVWRKVENAFGKRENVLMHRGNWDYLFWLESIGYDVRTWVKQCDLERGETPFGEALALAIYCEHERRQLEGIHPVEPEWWAEANARYLAGGD